MEKGDKITRRTNGGNKWEESIQVSNQIPKSKCTLKIKLLKVTKLITKDQKTKI